MASRFRKGDGVVITARDEFYSHVDGWVGRVVAVGPCPANACHYQIPEGHVYIEVDKGEGPRHFLVPHDQVEFALA